MKTIETLVAGIVQVMLDHSDDGALRVWVEAIEQEIIRRRGYKDGRSAGTWVFDGNTQEEHFLRIQKGVEEGDPEYLDMLPQPRIGGEFADDPTWEDILKDEGVRYDSELDSDGRSELLSEYESAFKMGVEDEVMAYGKHSVKS